jgi:YHS domain-containing protein
MSLKKIIFFIFAVALSLLAATHRFGDSAHSIGLVKAKGGKARHASNFESGKERYMLIATATVIPPYRGDARVALEGTPEIDYKLFLSGPVLDLGVRKFPKLKGDTIHDLKPMDRLALWVEMHPPSVDPVCGMAHEADFIRHTYHDKDYAFCGQMCVDEFFREPDRYADEDVVKGKYTLAFYDTKTDKQVLSVPLIFKGKGEEADAGGHHH